jgi:glycosyltransferase involved in cell wall biosynthesis
MARVVAVSFTNFGPYHLARLRALAARLAEVDGRVIAYETACAERTYPWQTDRGAEPFAWRTLFSTSVLEDVPRPRCARAMRRALERDQPDAVVVAGYTRPESMAALRWARRSHRPAILMSETQRLDYRRVWWKEAIKRGRVSRFAAAVVGGPRHRAYLAELGLRADRIALGYNAVDNALYASQADRARSDPQGRADLPSAPYFLAVSRFVPEKNLARLIEAFARYRKSVPDSAAWDLVLCGDGPGADEVRRAVASSGLAHAIHLPGFLQADSLARWYAFASAFVHPSMLEPWGLVVNEAAACGLPLLVSNRAGCAETLVPDPPGTTGWRFDPEDVPQLTESLVQIARLSEAEREQLGQRAARIVAEWGPDRFAQGVIDAVGFALEARRPRRIVVRQ